MCSLNMPSALAIGGRMQQINVRLMFVPYFCCSGNRVLAYCATLLKTWL